MRTSYWTLLALTVCFTTAARADWTEPRPLWNQGILNGTQHFQASGDSRVLDLDVDYAVFAPETFAGSLTVSFSPDAERSGYYVYAYQVYVNSPIGASQFSGLQVGLPEGVGLTVRSVGYDRDFDPSQDDIEATFGYALPDSVSFLFETPQLHPGEFGVTLLYSSPMPPTFFAATVYDSGLSDQQLLPAPAPLPVPGAALLGTLGLVGVSKIRRRIG